MSSIRTLWILAVSALFVPCLAQAQVSASLVSLQRTVQPGRPLTVALRLEHQPQWHTYWLNAGTGYPTRLAWRLPEGWTAADIQWPTPELLKDSRGIVTGHGYDGVLYLPVMLTPPADLQSRASIKISATATWLMCADICVPGKADLSMTLPASGGAPQIDASVQAGLARMPMPHGADGWKVSASQDAKAVTLHVTGPRAMKGPHFFAESEFIQYDKPQESVAQSDNITLTLPVAEDVAERPSRLAGVLSYTDGSGMHRGLKVDVPLSFGGEASKVAGWVVLGGNSTSGALRAGGSTSGLAGGLLILAFVGGLILNLMPCVFPVLGIKIVGFINQAGSDRRKVTLHGLLFTLGVVTSFWALAGVLAALRMSGSQMGWGFQLQSAPFVFVLAVIMLVFALSLSGLFEFGVRATGVGSSLLLRDGYLGTFFAGVLATIVATPCSAPFLAPALGAALSLPTGQSFIIFTAIAFGLSSPYLLLSAFPQSIKILPRPGRWMETFKQAMAFPLYATVAYLIWILAGQSSDNGLLAALTGLVLIAMAVWLYGRYSTSSSSIGRFRVAAAGALMLLACGLVLGWPRAAAATDLVWEPWSVERIAQLRAEEGRAIYVDFTARWCATCQANKKLVFGSNEVKRYFREHDVALLKADWTNSDPRITAELAKWNRSAVPFNLIYSPGEPEPTVLPEILTASIVLAALNDPAALRR